MAVLCQCTCASSHPAVIGACSSYARDTGDGSVAVCEGCRRALAAAPMDFDVPAHPPPTEEPVDFDVLGCPPSDSRHGRARPRH